MEWIKKLWNWVRVDGLLHILVCYIIVLTLCQFNMPWQWASVVALFAGIAKEVYDREHGTAEWHDIICDCAGIILADLVVCLSIWAV